MFHFAIPFAVFLFLALPLFAQTDTVPPSLQCKGHVQVNIGPTCLLNVWADDLIESLSDDNPGTPQVGIRKPCTGDGFPANQAHVNYSAIDLGAQQVEVWAADAAGNTASCTVHLVVASWMQNCDPVANVVVQHPNGAGVRGVEFVLNGHNCLGDTIPTPNLASTIITGANGYWGIFGALLEPGYTSTFTPSKTTNPLNGVTTADLAAIQRHILGLEPFDAPWKIIAADANLDGKVTLQDVVLLQKLLLGHILELPHGQSWRFYPKDHLFPDPDNPFLPALPNAIATPNTADPAPNLFQFLGVKIGDVTGNADPGL